MNIIEKAYENFLFFDGGYGTILQSKGLKPGELPELYNIDHPDIIRGIHEEYLKAGANILKTNTFGANSIKFGDEGKYSLENIIAGAIENARAAIANVSPNAQCYVALDIGSLGKLLKPLGDLDFEEAVTIFGKIVAIGARYGADLVLIETMNDIYEVKAAVLAAKENSDLPIMVTTAYDDSCKLLTGADPCTVVAVCEGLGVDALGVNCSLGPDKMLPIIKELVRYASIPVICNPNAGLPHTENGTTVFDVAPDSFAQSMIRIAECGARILGGCCGTTPEHISEMKKAVSRLKPVAIEDKNDTLVASYTHAVVFDKRPVLIGERINPTGKKRFKEALRNCDMDYILGEGLKQQDGGADILDVNVGLPEIDEVEMMKSVVMQLQAVTNLPLQIDTTDAKAMEQALRLYNGKAMINSVNGKTQVMEEIFPLVKKYGGLCVALTIDEDGIPKTAEGRLRIAEKIINKAGEYGIKPKDIIVDPLCMSISAQPDAAVVTLEAVRLIGEKLGVKTSLGVSNISFGLPNREIINSNFFTMAMNNGLGAAIMNPGSVAMMKSYKAFLALNALDENCASYIDFATNLVENAVVVEEKTAAGKDDNCGSEDALIVAITKGLKERAGVLTDEYLGNKEALEIIDNYIIPALDIVGRGFENKTMFLPQLLMSAEAASAAFDGIRLYLEKNGTRGESKGTVVIATVKGDIHDIGKNIVKTLLENYGYNVVDLGKDVSPEIIVRSACDNNARLVGLSALMTTTVPAMEETIKQLRAAKPDCKVCVGGAVLTQEYADMIGADKYSKDAMETVRYAEELFS